MRVKIFGAGSVGNHHANVARIMGWDVDVIDRDKAALLRMKNEIYPKRYGKWDSAIGTFTSDHEPKGGYDAVLIGTPPDSHLSIATKVLFEEGPKLLQIEKPLCSPTLAGVCDFKEAVGRNKNTKIVVGFNHILAQNTRIVEKIVESKELGKLLSMDCEIRSNWENILSAHPWLGGPEDSYLGYWQRGGGAGGEHCHALNLWQHFAHVAGAGRVTRVGGFFNYQSSGNAVYDSFCFLHLETQFSLIGRVAQDVVTMPKRKFAFLQFENGQVEWHNDVTSTTDEVVIQPHHKKEDRIVIQKTRAEEFLREIQHIDDLLAGRIDISDSPIRFERGLDTMKVLSAAHASFSLRGTVEINYN